METKKQFIRGDLNDFYDGRFPLRNEECINAIKKNYGKIYDGLLIWLFDFTIKNGKYDPTIFPGIIKNVGKTDEYEIVVDENDMKYLSESDEFKNYSIKDVIGEVNYNELFKQYPEKF